MLKSFENLGIKKHFALLLAIVTIASFDSKAQITHGTVERISVHGKALEGNLSGESATRAVFVYLPASYSHDPARKYPVLYLLHGASALGHNLWSGSLANIQDIADRTMAADTTREMIIVMPDASSPYLGTLYSNSLTDGNWEDYISDDLVGYVDAHYRTIVGRNSRGLAGHSRGGYGALRIGMKRPDVFSTIYALSPCCTDADMNSSRIQLAKEIRNLEDLQRMRERQPFGGPFTVLAQAAAWSPNAKKPPFYFDLPRDNDQEIAAKWVANSLLRLTEKNISNLKKLRALAFDVGNQDQGIGISVAVLKQLSSQLDSWNVRHTFETYDGTHVSKIPDRVEKNMLPFFSTNLSFGTGPTKH